MPLIETKGLTKLYRMGDSIVHALDGVDLVVERGEFVAITGASGSGKSTMMHLLGCLDRPTAGQYFLDGKNVAEMSDRELAAVRNQEIGFVFQTFNLINRTSALENVSIPLFYARKSNARKPAMAAIERVRLATRVTHSPSELSGGERQRVAIARAIVNDPLLVFADEPTGNLDSRTGEQIMEIFRSLNEQGVTIVLVTHEPEVALQARRIIQMRDGRILSDRLTADIQAETGAPAVRAHSLVDVPDSVPAAVVARSAATPPAPAPVLDAHEPDAAAEIAQLPPRRARGATGALIVGILAPIFLIAVFVVGKLAANAVQRTGFDAQKLQPGQMPPKEIMVYAAFSLLTFLLAIVCGITAAIWGRVVIRRTRDIPGNWVGIKRARAGWICGLATVLLPLVLIAAKFVMWAIRNANA